MQTIFKKKLLSSCIAAVAVSSMSSAFAQSTDTAEEIVVTGVRAAQEKAIDIKRNSSEMVDSIAAEDIGKLPDSTIADSLQRVTGIQIERSAGQGANVSIRGSREVLSTLNGELFLTAQNLTNSQVDLRDVPASLITGSNVSKSMNAKQLEGGIGGSIDLLTLRSLNLKNDGLNNNFRVKASQGSISSGTDPEVGGLIGYKWDDEAAMSLAYSYTDESISDNSVDTKAAQNAQDEASWAGNKDFNGDGDKYDRFLIMSNWDGPHLYNNTTDRKRLGLAYNFNSKLNDAFEVNLDSFYNKMEESAAGNYMNLGDETVDYDRSRITALSGITPVGNKTMYSQFYTTGWTKMMDGSIRTGVNANDRNTSAINNSVELKYDNGGSFTGKVRYIDSHAAKDTSDLILAQKADSPGGSSGIAYNVAGAKRVVNPGFIDDQYAVSFQANDKDVAVKFDPTLATKLKDKAAWYIHSSWLEGEHQEADLNVLRADGNFKLADEGLTSFDFGARISERSTTREQFHYFMPTGLNAYDPASGKSYSMLVKYHEAGYTPYFVPQGAIWNYRVQVGSAQNPATDPTINFEPVRGINLDETAVQKWMHTVTDFGAAAKGMSNIAIPMIDPGKIGDHLKFMNELYGVEHVKRDRPNRDYNIIEDSSSFYVQANFKNELPNEMVLSGNVGVRYVSEDLAVTKNIVDLSQMDPDVISGRDVNHTNFVDLGDETINVHHSHFLPSLNTNLTIADDFKVRFSYDKRMSLQALNTFGEGQEVTYQSQIIKSDGSRYQPIGSVKQGGNPYLNPWSASVYNLGAEWYPAESSLISAAYFYMDIGGFTDTKYGTASLPDSDGVIRNGASTEEMVNGKNAKVKGVELSYQQSFTMLPSFLANTGMTWNYTYSPSEKSGQKLQFDNSAIPFNSTAKNQSNLVLWYNDQTIEMRVAANYLGKQYVSQASYWPIDPLKGDSVKGLVGGLDQWTDSSLFVDLSGTYHINEDMNVSLNVQNLTEEGKYQYAHWSNFRTFYEAYERRITLGFNAKF